MGGRKGCRVAWEEAGGGLEVVQDAVRDGKRVQSV